MSINFSVRCIDKKETEKLLDSILEGSFQAEAQYKIPEFFETLKNNPAKTDAEIFMPMFRTPEAQASIKARLERRGPAEEGIRMYKGLSGYMEDMGVTKGRARAERVEAFIWHLESINSDSYFSSLGDVWQDLQLLFKHSGVNPELVDDPELTPVDLWNSVFNNITKEILEGVKKEIESNPHEYGTFDHFAETIQSIRAIQKKCNGIHTVFSVHVEDGNNDELYTKFLQEKVIEHLKHKKIESINPDGRWNEVFATQKNLL